MLNNERLNDNIKKIEKLLNLLKMAADENISLAAVGRELGLTPQGVNRELSVAFMYYIKKELNLDTEDINELIFIKESPSTRLLKKIFNISASDNVVFPDFDEEYFWSTLKDILPEKYFTVLSLRCGYNIDRPLTLEQIGKQLGCTRVWVNDMYNIAVNRIDTPVLYKIFNKKYIDLKSELENSEEYSRAKDEYNRLLLYLSKIDDIESLNKYIADNYPEVNDFDKADLNKMFSESIENLLLSTRLTNALINNGKHTLNDIYLTSVAEYKNMNNFGKKCFVELLEFINSRNDNHPNKSSLVKDLNMIINK